MISRWRRSQLSIFIPQEACRNDSEYSSNSRTSLPHIRVQDTTKLKTMACLRQPQSQKQPRGRMPAKYPHRFLSTVGRTLLVGASKGNRWVEKGKRQEENVFVRVNPLLVRRRTTHLLCWRLTFPFLLPSSPVVSLSSYGLSCAHSNGLLGTLCCNRIQAYKSIRTEDAE